jgi:hypothetical protein
MDGVGGIVDSGLFFVGENVSVASAEGVSPKPPDIVLSAVSDDVTVDIFTASVFDFVEQNTEPLARARMRREG